MKTVYEIELHEEISVNKIPVLRVPGGWIYGFVFVPFSAEFQFAKIRREIDPKVAIEIVRRYFNLPENYITAHRKYGNIPLAKKFIVDILMSYSSLNYIQVSELMKYKSHSGIPHARKALHNLIFSDKKIEMQYLEVLKALYLK